MATTPAQAKEFAKGWVNGNLAKTDEFELAERKLESHPSAVDTIGKRDEFDLEAVRTRCTSLRILLRVWKESICFPIDCHEHLL